MKIIQIAPDIGPGSGVAAVAWNLERQWASRGVETQRFTMAEARGGWLPSPGPGLSGKLVLLARVVWFSTVGTVLARRLLRRTPDAVSVCHNDVLAGDVYVNHGIVQAAMRARGGYRWRMLRNPVHVFTTVRDAYRYRSSSIHRLVVNLSHDDDHLLRRTHPRLAVPTRVIGNGVDLVAYRPPSDDERARARAGLDLGDEECAVVFVGHEFERKGLPLLLAALTELTGVRLVVVGGTTDLVAEARESARGLGVLAQVHFTGRVEDPRPFLAAADVFALPSSYEASPLVVLEALAQGLPVVTTRTGGATDLIDEGVSGHVVSRDADAVRAAVQDLQGRSRDELVEAARAAAERRSWAVTSRQYLDLLGSLRPAATARVVK